MPINIFYDLGVDDVFALVLFDVLVFQVSVKDVADLPDVDPSGLQMDSFTGATGTHMFFNFWNLFKVVKIAFFIKPWVTILEEKK